MSQWYIGTIGFSYKDWVGEFYPINITQKEYLPFYSKIFNVVEIDTTFHAIPKPSVIQSWFNITPDGFKFCLKTPRIITHELGLKASQGLMSEFLESIAPLKEKTGPILIQLPPRYTQDNIEDVDLFLSALPGDYQYAIEFRHLSWYNEDTVHLLTTHHICWVTVDYPKLPKQIMQTTDFIYIRWIGINGEYQRHSFERVKKINELTSWLALIKSYNNRVTSIYGFFNNDYTGCAASTCKRFVQLSGITKNEQHFPYQEHLF